MTDGMMMWIVYKIFLDVIEWKGVAVAVVVVVVAVAVVVVVLLLDPNPNPDPNPLRKVMAEIKHADERESK